MSYAPFMGDNKPLSVGQKGLECVSVEVYDK